MDPDIKIIVVGSGSYDMEWNRKVVEQCGDYFDYLSVHHYEGPQNYEDGPRSYEDFLRRTAEMIRASDNPDIKLYVSEWNAQSTDWRTGLYAGGLLNGFERLSDSLTIGGPALFLRHTSAQAWDNAFINFDQCGWYPAPNYVVMKLWRDHYAPLRLQTVGDRAGLNLVATKSADGEKVHLKAVNPTEKPVEVTVQTEGTFAPSDVDFDLVAPDSLRARNTLENPHSVRPEEGHVELDGDDIIFTMPGLSAGVISMSAR